MNNVEVERGSNENNLNVLRRFTKRVQGSGVLNRVRSIRYHSRNASANTVKKMTLSSLNRKKEVEMLIKLGKMRPASEHHGRRK